MFLSPLESFQCRYNPTLQLNRGSVLELRVAGPGAKAVLELHFDWCLKPRCKTKIASSSFLQGRRKKFEVNLELFNCSCTIADPGLSHLQRG